MLHFVVAFCTECCISQQDILERPSICLALASVCLAFASLKIILVNADWRREFELTLADWWAGGSGYVSACGSWAAGAGWLV